MPQPVDYLSAGHFHIYDRIIKQVEGAASPKMSLAVNIYPKLWANTEQIMAFHDRYTEVDIDQEVCLEFHRPCRISAKRWRRALRWKIS